MKFRVGEKLIFTGQFHDYYYITNGIYEVIDVVRFDERKSYVKLKNDKGMISDLSFNTNENSKYNFNDFFLSEQFLTLKEYRKQKIKKINIK